MTADDSDFDGFDGSGGSDSDAVIARTIERLSTRPAEAGTLRGIVAAAVADRADRRRVWELFAAAPESLPRRTALAAILRDAAAEDRSLTARLGAALPEQAEPPEAPAPAAPIPPAAPPPAAPMPPAAGRGPLAALRAHPLWTAGGAVALALAVTLAVTLATSGGGMAMDTGHLTPTSPAGTGTGFGAAPTGGATTAGSTTAASAASLTAANTIVVATCEGTSIEIAGYDASTLLLKTSTMTLAAPSVLSSCGTFDNDAYTIGYLVGGVLAGRAGALTALSGCQFTCLPNPAGTLAVTQDYDTSNSVILAHVSGGAVQSTAGTYTPAPGCEAAAWLDDASLLCVAKASAPDLVSLDVGSPAGSPATLPVSAKLRADGVTGVADVAFTADRSRLLIVGQTPSGLIMYTASAAGAYLSSKPLPSDSGLAFELSSASVSGVTPVVVAWTP